MAGSRTRSGRPRLPAQEDLEATVTFLRQWLRDPHAIAAVAPSSRALARRMASAIGRQARTVVELGAGTGAITRAILDYGVAPERLLIIERNVQLHDLLTARFPGVEVEHGDALDLVEMVQRSPQLEVGAVDAVVSGLGLLNFSRARQRRLLEAAFEILAPAGRFVQFTYAPVLPVARELLDELGLCSRRVALSLLNLPPAAIYVVTRGMRRR